jgi:hypothetical protein
LERYLYDPAELRPILVWEPTYQEFWHRSDMAEKLARDHTPSPSMIVFEDIANNLFLLLPGPYAACSPESAG